MSHQTSNQLTRAEQFFDNGKLDEALELLTDKKQFEGLSFKQKSYYQFLKGLIFVYQNKNSEIIELGEVMLKEGQELKENILSFDGLIFIILGLGLESRFKEALERIGQVDFLLELISGEHKNLLIRREFRLNVLKSWIMMQIGKVDIAQTYLEGFLKSKDELHQDWEMIWANLNMAYIKVLVKGRIDAAVEYNDKAMALAKKVKYNHYWLGYCHVGKGVIHSHKCEYELSFKHYMRSLDYFRQINNLWYIANLYNNLGNIHCTKGDYDLALKYLEEAIILWEPYPLLKDACLDSLIWASLEKGDEERAQKYFQRLENLYNEKKKPSTEELYKYNKALLLKRGSRLRDKGKAEELLKEVIESESHYFETKISALVHLCDLLLAEFRINNDMEVFKEINNYIEILLSIAEASRSYLIFCDTFILQAKLALLNFDLKAARRFLTQAQKIAESYGITRLAMKISHEHDELIKQSKMWENFKDLDLSLIERWRLAGLNEQIEKMVKKQIDEVPELTIEKPVLLLIVSEGGIPLFSHSFVEDKLFESHLFAGFLSTIDYFIKEMFSEGLDRAVFGDHTLIMKSMPPFFISYIFKGNSYYALQKADNFIEKVQNDEHIWKRLLKFFQANQSVQLDDVPKLDSLVSEIF
jgi:tetratricopeptide (TPR) repeat protein